MNDVTFFRPEVAKWLRERSRVKVEYIAKTLKISAEDFLQIENSGVVQKSSIIKKLAELYGAPVDLFYLIEIPPHAIFCRHFGNIDGWEEEHVPKGLGTRCLAPLNKTQIDQKQQVLKKALGWLPCELYREGKCLLTGEDYSPEVEKNKNCKPID